MPDFRLPDLGEGVTEAEIDKWLVSEGDVIEEDDPLVDVITDKASAEIPSPYGGKILKIFAQAGDVVPVGSVLVTVAVEGESMTKNESSVSPSRPSERAETVNSPTRPPDVVARVKAMPPVRKLARNLGVDLSHVRPSGADGRITREDVQDFHARGNPPSDGSPGQSGITLSQARRVPFRGIRRLIGDRMAEAHRVIPPVTHVEECDVTELERTRKLANERTPDALRLTFLPFIVKAVVQGLKDYPALNASLDQEAGDIVYHQRYDIGIAVDSPAGLIVPVIRDADEKGLRGIAADIERLANDARTGRLKPEDLREATFTVTSPGPYGGLMATPIVFHPQSGILGVHRATDRPMARDGQIVIRKVMNLSITFDHRILDGMTAAKFARELVQALEHPGILGFEL